MFPVFSFGCKINYLSQGSSLFPTAHGGGQARATLDMVGTWGAERETWSLPHDKTDSEWPGGSVRSISVNLGSLNDEDKAQHPREVHTRVCCLGYKKAAHDSV